MFGQRHAQLFIFDPFPSYNYHQPPFPNPPLAHFQKTIYCPVFYLSFSAPILVITDVGRLPPAQLYNSFTAFDPSTLTPDLLTVHATDLLPLLDPHMNLPEAWSPSQQSASHPPLPNDLINAVGKKELKKGVEEKELKQKDLKKRVGKKCLQFIDHAGADFVLCRLGRRHGIPLIVAENEGVPLHHLHARWITHLNPPPKPMVLVPSQTVAPLVPVSAFLHLTSPREILWNWPPAISFTYNHIVVFSRLEFKY